jgi:putative oxidoreductase
MNSLNKVGVLVGRILMALIFLLSGIGKFAQPAMSLAYMKMNGVPAAQPLLYLSAIIEIAGGLTLLIGFRARWAALILFLWLIPVTLMMHAIPGGQMNQVEMMKNLAIMGGLLIVAAQGAGAYSVSGD